MNKYKKDDEYSYSFGAFPTFELLSHKSEHVQCLLISEKLVVSDDIQKLLDLAKSKNIEIVTSEKQIRKIADKDNIFVVGVFKKYKQKITPEQNHIVLVNPSDMGNLGTIIRTMAGFNMQNLAIISPCADIFNPKTIRSSMGATFKTNIQIFESFEEYQNANSDRNFFPFMLKGVVALQNITEEQKQKPYSLIFGNEATGLCDSFLNLGTSIVINHSKNIDSLNLPISVSMALYEFNKEIFK